MSRGYCSGRQIKALRGRVGQQRDVCISLGSLPTGMHLAVCAVSCGFGEHSMRSFAKRRDVIRRRLKTFSISSQRRHCGACAQN